MIRFLERSGYDVSYISGIDAARNGALLMNHKVFLTAGHDEYWDTQQRANVLAARDAGVSLAFSGNDDDWKTWATRAEEPTVFEYPVPDPGELLGEDLVERQDRPVLALDRNLARPAIQSTGRREQSENALGGTLFMSNITDPLPHGECNRAKELRIWRNTGLASQSTGQSTALAPHTVGYESNEDLDNGFRPAGPIDMSTVSASVPAELRVDFGTGHCGGHDDAPHHPVQGASGALVLSAGTIQWAWGLTTITTAPSRRPIPGCSRPRSNPVGRHGHAAAGPDQRPVATAKSTDTTAPTSVITSPPCGRHCQVTQSTPMTRGPERLPRCAGGGGSGGVEVPVDGGSKWHSGTGPGAPGPTTAWPVARARSRSSPEPPTTAATSRRRPPARRSLRTARASFSATSVPATVDSGATRRTSSLGSRSCRPPTATPPG